MASISSRTNYRPYTSTPNATVTTTPEPSTSSTASSNAPTGTASVSTSSTASSKATTGTASVPTVTQAVATYTAQAPETKKASGSNTANAPIVTTTAPVSSFNNTPSMDPFSSFNTASMGVTPTPSYEDQVKSKVNDIYGKVEAYLNSLKPTPAKAADFLLILGRKGVEDWKKRTQNSQDYPNFNLNDSASIDTSGKNFDGFKTKPGLIQLLGTYNGKLDAVSDISIYIDSESIKTNIEKHVRETLTMVTPT